jgi:hypothetical protein
MSLRTSTITLGLLGGCLCLAPWAQGGSPPPLSGEIMGQVKGATGIVQMGATVLLYNRFDQLVRQGLTTEQGKFVFDALPPDLYSIRVTLASFVPALRRNIAVAAGSKSVLQINMANLLSTVDLVSSTPTRGTLMSDDWKWVLRTSQATRPVLRFLPDANSSSSSHPASAIFGDTSGLVTLSGGDGGSFTTGSQQDLGTAFALATSIYGSTRMQFSGNFGYAASSGLPTSGFRTTYSRTEADGSGPQVTLTIHQLYLPNRATYVGLAGNDGAPAMRTMSLETRDKIDLTDTLHLEYGLGFDSVSFLQRLNYVSPFARVTYDLDEKSSLRLAYSSGMQPAELAGGAGEAGLDLTQDLTALAQLPHVSLRDGQAHVQRTQTYEMGYRRVAGTRTYSAGMYREAVANAALILSGLTNLPSSDLLPDLGSGSSIFNVGNYQSFGYTAAMAQTFGDGLEASLAAGRGGALTADPRNVGADASDVRGLIHDAQRTWATLRVSETLRGSGTRIITSYGWTDPGAMMPAHLFLTQESNQATGLNIRLRQPLPMLFGLPGRLEAMAEVNNLLAQGYLPLSVAGRRALLTNSPRAVRAGLNFIF